MIKCVQAKISFTAGSSSVFINIKVVVVMADGWRPIVVPDEIYDRAKKYYEENKEQLKLKYGVRSLTGFLNFCIREYLKDKGII